MHSHPNYTLLFGGTRIQRSKVVLLLRLLDRSKLWSRDMVAHATKRCSMKRKSTICAMQSLLDCVMTRMRERLSKNTQGRRERGYVWRSMKQSASSQEASSCEVLSFLV
jgi:hypothetical protein